LRVGLARCGDVDVELIAVEAGDHPIADHLREHGPGLHHVAFEVDDLDARSAELQQHGFDLLMEGSAGNGIRFRHLKAPAPLGSVFELMQLPASEPAR
jgi:methylmalonyl-CoA mutase C-terminal domain/subunit